MEIRPENEYEKLLRLSNEYTDEKTVASSVSRPCGGFSLRYECACDLYQTQCYRAVQNVSEQRLTRTMDLWTRSISKRALFDDAIMIVETGTIDICLH